VTVWDSHFYHNFIGSLVNVIGDLDLWMTKLLALIVPLAKNAMAFSGVSAYLMTLHSRGISGVVYSNSQAGMAKEWVTKYTRQALNTKKSDTREDAA
jgi:hypothetical protein